MSKEEQKDFNAMLHKATDMPRLQIVTDKKTIQTYGGERMFLAPPLVYDALMKQIPSGRLTTARELRAYLARQNNADFTDPMTAGIFINIAAWASAQRQSDPTPYWRTLKGDGQLNAKYPGGVEAQKALLEAEGHTIIQKGRKNIRYYVADYEAALYVFPE